MDKAALLALADRVEALTEPDRSVDASILEAIFPEKWQKLRLEAMAPCGCPDDTADEGARDYVKYRSVYWFTESIDAAESLIPDAWNWMAGNRNQPLARAYVENGHPAFVGFCARPNPNRLWFEVVAATPAITLTAAALRARASQ